MLALMSPPAIIAPCTAEPDLLLSHADYTLAASCAPAGDVTTVALTVRNQYRGKARIEEFHVSFHGRVLPLTTPPGWTVTQEGAPTRGDTIVTWRAGKGSSVKRNRSLTGFVIQVEGNTARFSCHRGI